MAYLTNNLDVIRGYTVVTKPDGTEYKSHDISSYYFNNVRDAIADVLTFLSDTKYSSVNIVNELFIIKNNKWGPDIRDAIYNAVKKLLKAADMKSFENLSKIHHAHYGSEIREPLYSVFVQLGANDIDVVYSTKDGNKFHTSDDLPYCVIKGV